MQLQQLQEAILRQQKFAIRGSQHQLIDHFFVKQEDEIIYIALIRNSSFTSEHMSYAYAACDFEDGQEVSKSILDALPSLDQLDENGGHMDFTVVQTCRQMLNRLCEEGVDGEQYYAYLMKQSSLKSPSLQNLYAYFMKRCTEEFL